MIDVFTKYAWVKPLKDKAKTVPHGLVEMVNESKHKPKILWVAQGKFYNSLTKKCLDGNILMYST